MERKEAIRSAYHMTGSNSFYDGMMTCSTLPGRAVCRLVWDMNRQDCVRYQEKAVSGIPEDFAGRLLEVPVGTGILTMPLYRTLPRAEITCLDYSPDMMAQAQEKARRMHLGNVAFRQGDVGALPFESGSFDAVVAANVIHLLDEPLRALRELDRVCRPGGRIIIPTYMNGTESGRTNGVSSAIGRAGADFKREFTPESYRAFFERAGYRGAQYTLCRGRIPCAVSVLRKTEENT